MDFLWNSPLFVDFTSISYLLLATLVLFIILKLRPITLHIKELQSDINKNLNDEQRVKARYDNYRIYRVHLETEKHVTAFKELKKISSCYVFFTNPELVGQYITITVPADKISQMNDLLERFNVSATILNYNLQDNIDIERNNIKPVTTNPKDFDWENYHHLKTIYGWLDSLTEKFDFITPISLGESYEGREIRGVKLSKKDGNSGIFLEAGIHAREWVAPASATFVLYQLIYSKDPEIQYISESFDWYIVPVLNPDGYVHTFERDRLWRKTRKPNGVCVGVDLNRNFDSDWNGVGASSDPSVFNYAGPYVNSEPEAKNLVKYLQETHKTNRIQTYFALHAYSQLIMFPNGYTVEKVSNYDDLKLMGEKAARAIELYSGRKYLTGNAYETIYPSSGCSVDWAKEKLNIPIAYTFELRGPSDSLNMFMLPANEIIPTGWETMIAFKTILREAVDLGYYK